ncbi:unnamed protein product [Trichobilharzia szidati]|nr:unnamed protein product [Trichobilharzia szidati]
MIPCKTPFVDILGIRIKPCEIVFRDIQDDSQYTSSLTVQNVCSSKKTVRFYPPSTETIEITDSQTDIILAPGICHNCTVFLKVSEAKESTESIVLTIDGNPHKVPIHIFTPIPVWNIPRSLNLGVLVQENRVITKTLFIENKGSKHGKFRILSISSSSIDIVPRSGMVEPNSHVNLKVTFIPRDTRDFVEVVRIQMDGSEVLSIEVVGKVIKPEFKVTNCKTTEGDKSGASINHWNYGYLYYNSNVYCRWNLTNYSPKNTSFFASFCNKNDSKLKSSDNVSKSARSGSPVRISEYFSINPDHGELKPFEKLPVSIRLAPRWKKSKQGFISLNESPPIKPFSVYLRIRKVDLGAGDCSNKEESQSSARSSFTLDEKNDNLEIILTGCLIPVQLLISPNNQPLDAENQEDTKLNEKANNEGIKIRQMYENQLSIHFPACLTGLKRCAYLKLSNQSKHLPVHFQIPRIAHFTVKPDKGVISPLNSCSITVCFSPKQFGEFHTVQHILILSKSNDENPTVIYQSKLIFHGYSPTITIPQEVKFNPGIVPTWGHEVGRNTDRVTFGSNYECPRAAIISLMSMKSLKGLQSHVSRFETLAKLSTKIAFPNDRYASVRPTNKQDEFKTLFCRLARYTYTDPDYEWNEEEMQNISKRQLTYSEVYRDHAQLIKRIQDDRKLMRWNEPPNDGVVLMELDKLSPRLGIEDFEEFKQAIYKGGKLQPISDRKITESTKKDTKKKKKAVKVLPLKPVAKSTANEECNWTLTVKDIDEISIHPTKVEFEHICPDTESTKFITITNPLNQCISFRLDTNQDEFKPTTIRYYVIQPRSKLDVPIKIKISKLCSFQCNLNFSVNDQYKSNLVVCATVVPVELTLAPSSVELTSANSSCGLIRISGMRGYVTLFNPLHAAAKFHWQSAGTQNPFTIRPKSGIVEPFSSLNCEIVFYPCQRNTSMEGRFQLKMPGVDEKEMSTPSTTTEGYKAIELLCTAKLLPSKLSFSTRRLTLGSIAHGLPCTRQITVFNLGQNSILFTINKDFKNIVNLNGGMSSYMHRLSGALPAKVEMEVSPTEGEIPVGGEITLKVTCLPIGLGKFESTMILSTYDGQNIDLSVCGSVLKPQIELVSNTFEFGGGY